MIQKACDEKIAINFGKYFEGDKKRTLECCLWSPHPKYYHYSPCLLITCGGHTAKAKGWRSWVAEIGEEDYKAS